MGNIVKKKLKINGMHCTSCAMNIDFELEDTEGVKEVKTSYVKQITEVSFDPEKVSIENMVSVIKKLDEKYDASLIQEK